MNDGGAAGGEAARQTARFAAAHRALLDDADLQFRLVRPPSPASTPGWLRAIGEWMVSALRPIVQAIAWLFSWLPDWPWARLLLWTVIALVAVMLLWMAFDRARHGEWRRPSLRRRRRADTMSIDEEDSFHVAPTPAWLREADALAALGRFAEAAHLLLFRSVEDLARRRPEAVRPALTSRELATASVFPAPVRERFALIAALVERSLFGGRPVDADEWRTARASYAELALPGAWRR